ncbi:MAG: DUF3810 domain-containing protein [Flavobacteriaceae bacterium]
MYRNKKLILAILFPVQLLLINVLSAYPNIIETYYSTGVYPIISKALRFVFGWVPFSVGDVLYAILIIYILKWLYSNFKSIYKRPKQTLLSLTAFLSVIYFCFHFLWGLNYYRNPIYKTLNLDTEYTTEDLIHVTKNLIATTNNIHLKIAKHDSIKVTVPYSNSEIYDKTMLGYVGLQKTHPNLTYQQKSIKNSLWSLPLSYAGYSGYLNPFTNEAQVNSLIPKYHFPLVSCHEEGHQIGYAAENETNFIGYLACIKNPDFYFQYAGATFAVRYCLNEVYRRNPETYKKLIAELHSGILKNFKESQQFLENYQNPTEPIFKSVYDMFLKSNNQQHGIKSYNYVVALIVNYENSRSL